MIEKITRLPCKRTVVPILCSDDSLARLLSNLLKDFVQPLIEQISGIRSFGPFTTPPFDQCIQRAQDLSQIATTFATSVGVALNCIMKARDISGVTSRTVGFYTNQNGI